MEGLEQKLSYRFRDRKLLDEALSHSSYVNEHRGSGIFSNERLEFLGDSVLGFVTAEFLFRQHPTAPEGDLTRIRAALVCEQSLYEVAQKLELGKYLKLGRGEEAGGGRTRPSILADATEAVFAAVYLDAGMEKAAQLVDLAMDGYETSEKGDRDAKSALQEYLQALGEETPTYEIIGQDGPPHARVFTARVLRADGSELGTGTGARKQRAEEAAAQMAMRTLQGENS